MHGPVQPDPSVMQLVSSAARPLSLFLLDAFRPCCLALSHGLAGLLADEAAPRRQWHGCASFCLRPATAGRSLSQ